MTDGPQGLVTVDTYTKAGRVVHNVELPEGFAEAFDPRQLDGLTVLLDGMVVRVVAVEAPKVAWPHAALRDVGLAVEDIRP